MCWAMDDFRKVSSHHSIRFTSRVSSRGQVVVPKELRKELGIEEGDQLIFFLDDQGDMHLELEKRKSITQVFGTLQSDKPFQSVEDLRKNVYRSKAVEELGNEDATIQ